MDVTYEIDEFSERYLSPVVLMKYFTFIYNSQIQYVPVKAEVRKDDHGRKQEMNKKSRGDNSNFVISHDIPLMKSCD